jgi:hypothetical protein
MCECFPADVTAQDITRRPERRSLDTDPGGEQGAALKANTLSDQATAAVE